MKKKILHIAFSLCYSLIAFAQKNNEFKLLNPQKTYIAGTNIKLCFKNKNNQKPVDLYFSNSYGNVLISPSIQNQQVQYAIPKHIGQKSGWAHWQLTSQQEHIKGDFYIQPTQNITHIETYLGPPSVLANAQQFSVLVVMPIDDYGNPVAKGTPVNIQKKYLNTTEQKTLPFNGMIGYEKIKSRLKTGRVFISSACLNKTSKEYTLEIMPNAPVDFKIFSNRLHNYADGNQITKFYSSTIKDMYNNVVADGTLVDFKIKNSKGFLLQAFGATINGVATAQMVHPEHRDIWNIQAFVHGFAKSNSIELTYKSAIQNFNMVFSQKNKTLKIGPFKSFMNQILPDGLFVNLTIKSKDKQTKHIHLQTENGYAVFDLYTILEKNKAYVLKVKAAQIHKQLKIKNQ